MIPALEVRQVSYRYGQRTALDGVSFQVAPGSFTALLGPNGAGKTTLFALATGLFESREGSISVFGHDMKAAPRAALARTGVVFQLPTLDLDLTVEQNLRYFGALHGLADPTARIEAELARFGLAERRRDKVRSLNGGHRRRVEIARALLHKPDLLLLDEPTVGLDPPTRRQLVELVHGLCAEQGLAVLWATHLVDEVADTDRLVVLRQGSVRAEGTVPEVLERLQASRLEALFP
jgi:ABC-2 type transport system ATP-binding protein